MIIKSKKTIVIILISLFAFNLFALSEFASARSNTIHVYFPDSIQAAVTRANPGDTIVVHEGTYQEEVIVSKDYLTLKGDGAVVESPGYDDTLQEGLVLWFWLLCSWYWGNNNRIHYSTFG